MANWKTEKALYEIHEVSRKQHEVYMMIATGEEISKWCKTKYDFYGYIDGVGGDRSYACWAVKAIY